MEKEPENSLPSTLYTEEYFLTACEGYDVFLESEGRQLSRRLRDAFSKAEVEPGMRLLDVGCGRGEILRRCHQIGVEAHGIDYAKVAVMLSRDAIHRESLSSGQPLLGWVYLADAKRLPFPNGSFDRVLLFDVVEHLFPWELQEALLEVRRVLAPDGRLIVHTAPNRWYDAYAYPLVRLFRRIQGRDYPKDPRALVPVNQDVHVNEQDMRSMRRVLRAAGFTGRVWLASPPQNLEENLLTAVLRWIAFKVPPFRWFFEREVFAVATKR